jgi:hypothetical protein
MSESKNIKINKREYWREQIQKWQDSNLSQSLFCSQTGIKLSTFIYWRSLFSASENKNIDNFVPIKVIKDTNLASDEKIEIKLTSGHIVYLPLKIGINEISKIIQSLGLLHA